MIFRDIYGKEIQYGDIVLDLRDHSICQIARSSVSDQPVLFVLKKFNRWALNYENVVHHCPPACYENRFIPEHGKLYWFFHGTSLPDIELLQHGERNRRIKEI